MRMFAAPTDSLTPAIVAVRAISCWLKECAMNTNDCPLMDYSNEIACHFDWSPLMYSKLMFRYACTDDERYHATNTSMIPAYWIVHLANRMVLAELGPTTNGRNIDRFDSNDCMWCWPQCAELWYSFHSTVLNVNLHSCCCCCRRQSNLHNGRRLANV